MVDRVTGKGDSDTAAMKMFLLVMRDLTSTKEGREHTRRRAFGELYKDIGREEGFSFEKKSVTGGQGEWWDKR
jgi:hypothetical protein